MRKTGVIFVGGFSTGRDGTLGGQVFACRTLLDCPISDHVEWHLVDTTMRSLPPPAMPIRVWDASLRLLRFVALLLFRDVSAVLIFSSFGSLSLLEKGLMGIVAHGLRRRVVLFIRSEVAPPNIARIQPFLRAALSACSRILCQTEEARSRLVESFSVPAEKCVVIRNWIDVEPYAKIGEARVQERTLRFLYLGWLEERKGLRELIEAACTLQNQGIDFSLAICGSGSLGEELRDRVRLRALRQVEFRGWTTGQEKIAQLAACDVMVLPSHSEGTPNSVLEGMTAGMAIIGTDIVGIATLVDDGLGGVLVPPGDAEALARAMIDLALDRGRIRAMGQYNARRVAECHDVAGIWPVIAEAVGVAADVLPVRGRAARRVERR